MTLKYESEILFDLMKRDGDDTPSDVLPYESELKEKYLKQVEGAYPKLQDYRPEWLNYNLFAHIPADFPVETLSNVTEATVDNVVPYAYRSAILKGQTLVNTLLYEHIELLKGAERNGNTFTLDKSQEWSRVQFLSSNPLWKANEKYTTILYDVVGDVSKLQMCAQNGLNIAKTSFTNNKAVFVMGTGREVDKRIAYIESTVSNESGVISFKAVVLKGDYSNIDIPFFTGMQSVKMPVLTTTGKNLLDTTSTWFNGFASNSSVITQSDSTKSLIVEVKPNTTYTFTRTQLTNRLVISSFKGNHEDLPITKELFNDGVFNQNTVQFTTPDDAEYVIIYVHHEPTTPNGWVGHGIYQLEEGSVVTSYEPFKSNILTVNEPVELRGIGEVQDELNCLTGELTQRIEKIELNIRFITYNGTNLSGNDRFILDLRNSISNFNELSDNNTINNHYFTYNSKSGYNYGEDSSYYFNLKDQIYISFTAGKYTEQTLRDLFNEKPFIIHFPTKTESIKTVDLTVKDQDGNTLSRIKPIEGTMHLSTSGTPIKPSFNGEIPVEATNQNLASFIEE